MKTVSRDKKLEIVACGECMLEMSRPGGDHWLGSGWQLGYGGDVFNTSLYLARQGHHVRFLTAIGEDACSGEMLERWRSDGIDVSLVLRHPSRTVGLYAIRTDAHGERSFSYWRMQSAMRELFALPDAAAALEAAARADLLYLSGITLSLFDPAALARLLTVAQAVRARGGQVAFDPNYRPAGWAGRAQAQQAIRSIAATVSIALPTLEDESALWGIEGADAVIDHWRDLGAGEVVVKQGSSGCHVFAGNSRQQVPAERVAKVVDTTGAGDAFNAAYLSSRLRGDSPPEAAAAGHALAARVIQHPGAILPG
jgi:2-dehydro-3-deoxygluconokinase